MVARHTLCNLPEVRSILPLPERTTMPGFSIRDIQAISKLTARAFNDASYARKLMANPDEELRKMGVAVPDGMRIHFVRQGADAPQSSETDIYLRIMDLNLLGELELDEEKMAKVAGGGSCRSTASTALTIPSCVSSQSTASTVC